MERMIGVGLLKSWSLINGQGPSSRTRLRKYQPRYVDRRVPEGLKRRLCTRRVSVKKWLKPLRSTGPFNSVQTVSRYHYSVEHIICDAKDEAKAIWQFVPSVGATPWHPPSLSDRVSGFSGVAIQDPRCLTGHAVSTSIIRFSFLFLFLSLILRCAT